MIGPLALAASLGLGCQTSAKPDPNTDFRDLLAKHVKNGRVNYKAIAGDDMKKLDGFVAWVGSAALPSKKNARIGFYIDAYNALVIKSVITNKRPRSVLDLKGFFDAQPQRVAGAKVTLDSLEKKVLNPYAKDPRTHFVLVCAAVGCPILEEKPYTGSNVDKRMDAATRRYLASPTGAQISEGSLKLSMIFKWYEKDFGGKEGVIAFVKRHIPPSKAKSLGATPNVEYLDYNWTLNQR